MAEARDSKQLLRLKNRPKDLQVMANILKEMGVDDYEPGVLNHMLEFSHRYITSILNEAYAYSRHANKQTVDDKDVKLAIEMYHDRLASPPSRDVIDEIAKQKNSIPLPQIKSNAGLRLPSDRHSLTACNYRVKTVAKKPKFHCIPALKISNFSGNKAFPLSSSPPNKQMSNILENMDAAIAQFHEAQAQMQAQAQAQAQAVSSTLPDIPIMAEVIPVSAVTTMPQILLPSFGISSVSSSQMLMSSMGIISTSMSQMLPNPEDGVPSSTSHIHVPTSVPMNTETVNTAEALSMFKQDDKERNEDDNYDEDYDLEASNDQFDME